MEDDLILYMDEFSTDNKTNRNNRTHKNSDRLLETDNTNNPKPTHGPEIDDLEPDEKPLDIEPNDKGIDDGLLPERPKNKPPGNYPFPKNPQPGFPPELVPAVTTSPDVNVYQQKKTVAEGMMDLALISANVNQLRYVLQSNGSHRFYYSSLVMIGMSLFLQIAVGIGLIWNSRYNIKDQSQMFKANVVNNWTIIGVFLVTVLNVFISSFGIVETSEKSVPNS